MTRRVAVLLLGLGLALSGCAHFGSGSLPPGEALTTRERLDAIRRAEVWAPTDIRSLDLKAGPFSKGGFAFNEWEVCEYKEKKLTGQSTKFVCETAPGREIRVKYGLHNAEVFGEVLSTRLFWALGFKALRVNPVRVRCHGCPTDPWRSPEKAGEAAEFDPAIIKEWVSGRLMETSPDSGWEWPELEQVGPEAGDQARAQRDALKLLAAFVQHGDSKASNQILMCPEGEEVGRTGCRRPVLMVSDFGLTFGRASLLYNAKKSASFARWSRTPVWKDPGQCVALLPKAFGGTLVHPRISEAGRAFLAGLLVQLSDAQLRDLFEVGRVERLPRDPDKGDPPASLDEWVAAFKNKRQEIVDNHCPQ